MSEKFQNKYRIDTFRLQNWDYRWPASYFVTICTKNREHYFGEVKNGKMILSPTGVIADILWHEIKAHTTNVELDAFVVMPDHIHGIITIKKTSSSGEVSDKVLHVIHTEEVLHATPPTGIKNQRMSDISPKAGSLSTIIRSYKSAVTKHAHRLGFEFVWQSLFYERIIRNPFAFSNIKNYIIQNPKNWKGS